MLLPLNFLASAPIQALSFSLYAYLMLEDNKTNPSTFSLALSFEVGTCSTGCTRRDELPLGSIFQSPESEYMI